VRKTCGVHSTFNIVIWVVCVLAVVIALGLLLFSGRTWEDFGKGRFTMDRDDLVPTHPSTHEPARSGHGGSAGPASPSGIAERDTEIRQLLEARNALRTRRGEAPIDVEQELARLRGEGTTEAEPEFARPAGAPADPHPGQVHQIDPELREEIRQLVVARNHRRVRSGRPPLDVEAEIEREIAELGNI
jgi:hypothetical protein